MEKDPTRTLMLRNNFARKLRRLYRNALKNVINSLPILHEMKVELNIDDINFNVDREYDSILPDADKLIKYNIPLVYRKGFMRATRQLKEIGIKITDKNFTIRDLEAMKVLYENGLNLVKGLSEDAKKEAKRIIADGYINGDSIKKIAKNLKEKVGGMTDTRSEMIARTETIRAYNTAAKNQYSRWGIKKYYWITAISERTCKFCIERDGKIFMIDEPPPPLHPNCRCSIYPYLG